MPRKFDTIEVLPHEPPFPAALMDELGLGGIHCGSARRLFPDWVNTDRLHLKAWDETESEHGKLARAEGSLYYLEFDSRNPYPFEDAAFQWAHAEHFIEHLTLEEAIGWMTDVRRILKPGGHLRVSTPDLRLYIEGYLDRGNGFFAEHRARLSGIRAFREEAVPDRRGWMVNQIFYRWGHKWIFDFDEIRFAGEQAGFDPAGMVQRSFGEGSDPKVASMDIAGRNDESIYVELTA
jgi:predicted SAM-dependent methyltransferase